ncbi:glycosyltransferase [Paenibacillus sp. FSL M7-1455]|jgi:glycosyltransferase involved in cell wall biosynthesis|uniref:glycosyltransferase n=1 Tax=Paenibacillus sp. FSL M7-1455 TaxID=2975316 RepID=UPI0030FB3163
MIVKNEERCLARCLESVKDFVQEIIIVDTGSTDRTVEIAKKYTSKIYSFDWTNNFAEARNYALQYATCEYILQLDADEWIGEGGENLGLPLDRDYYFLRIRNDIGSGFAEFHQFVRLFKNDPLLKYEGALHEQINLLKHDNLSFDFMKVLIHHDGYTTAVVQSKDKNERNMKIIKEEVRVNPSAFNYHNLGMQLSFENRHEEALEALKKSYSMAPDLSFAPRVLAFIVKSLTELNRFQEAVDVCSDSALLYPTKSDFPFRLGLIYEHLDYIEDAIDCFKKCLEIGESPDVIQFSNHEGTGSFMAHGKLAELYTRKSDYASAKLHFIEAVKEAPDLLYLLKVFVDLYPNLRGTDFVDALVKIWPLDETKRLEQMIAVLYRLRHPGAYDLIKCYRVETPTEVAAWIAMVENDFIQAKLLWNTSKNINEEHRRDILLLSFLLQENDILQKHKNLFNCREKEWKWWNQLLLRDELSEITITPDLEKYWAWLCEDLLNLKKYDELEFLLRLTKEPLLRYYIAFYLNKHGFSELALTVVVESKNNKENEKIFSLVRNILRDLGQIDDAIYYGLEAYKINPRYSNAYELFLLLTKNQMFQEAGDLLSQMRKMEPTSAWANRIHLNDFSAVN